MTLLCIDDDLEDLELLSEAIGMIDSGFICVTANNGQRALELIDGVRPDFIFLDINMPLMNGQQTLQAIRNNHALNEIPVCILSTTITNTQRELLIKMGASYCVKKATNFEEFCEALKSVFSATHLI
jgi:CheY-like chemotaxis protein